MLISDKLHWVNEKDWVSQGYNNDDNACIELLCMMVNMHALHALGVEPGLDKLCSLDKVSTCSNFTKLPCIFLYMLSYCQFSPTALARTRPSQANSY